MEVKQQQLEQLFEQVQFYAEGWNEMLQAVGLLTTIAMESPRPQAYLEYLVPRLRALQRRMNRVYYSQKGRFYIIENYTYEMFCWYLDKGFPEEAIRPNSLRVLVEWLKPEENDEFRKRIEL